MKLNLVPVIGVNFYKLPKQYVEQFKHSANEEDCVPVNELHEHQHQEVHRELKVVKERQVTNLPNFGSNVISIR